MVVERDLVVCRSGYYYSNGRCYRSSWYGWGRWVLAGAVILFFILLFVIIGCISARRRRKRGLHPMYGTGWMASPGKHGGQYPPPQQQWYGPAQQQQPQYGPPQYDGQTGQYQYGMTPQQNPQYTGTTFQTSDGYYGGHNEGVQLQSPPNTYQSVYAPPAGPPPGK